MFPSSNAILSITSVLAIWLHAVCYKELSDKEFKIDIKNLLIFFIFGFLFIVNNNLINIGITKIIISIAMLAIMYKMIFGDSFKDTLVKCTICYAILVLVEIILSVAAILLNVTSVSEFNESIILKIVFSILELSITILIIRNKKCNELLNKVITESNKDKVVSIFLIFTAATVIILVSKYQYSFSKSTYLANIALILIFTGLMYMSVKNNIKAKRESNKTETLLKYMTKYEQIIDEERMNRHETLNNLLLLKSIKDKNSVDFDVSMKDIICLYEKNGKETIKNIGTLPTGLKGILYYKIDNMKKLDIDVMARISNTASPIIEELKGKDYNSVCKILSILLDNANEAACESEEKSVLIDISALDGTLNIIVENSFKDKVNIKKLHNRYYSTKGNGRGLGLFLANKIVKENNNVNLVQNIHGDRFVSEIIVNVKEK